MKRKLLSLLILSALAVNFMFTGCNSNQNTETTPATQESTETTATKTENLSSKAILNKYFNSFIEGDNPVYGTWKMEGFDYLSFIFRNNGYAMMAMGTEGNKAVLKLDEENKSLGVSFIVGLDGTYNYEMSEDNETMTLSFDGKEVVMEKQTNYDFIPKAPKKPVIDKNILGWWKSEDGLMYYFGKDGIMYSDIITTETCYTYEAADGKIKAVYDFGGEVTDELEYKYKNGTLTLEGNKYKPFDPFE